LIIAQKLLSEMYLGDYGFKDEHKSVYWLKLAAEQGDIEAERLYGEMILNYNDKNVINTDSQEAVEWLRQAAAQGDIISMIDLAALLSEGDVIQSNTDFAFQMVASCVEIIDGAIKKDESFLDDEMLSQVERIAQILTKLGIRFLSENNYEMAFHCFDRSVELKESGENCRWVGVCYKNGFGVKKDIKKAKKYLKKALTYGDKIAKNKLGLPYV